LTRLRQLNVLPEDEDDLPMESERAGLFFDAVGMGPSDEEWGTAGRLFGGGDDSMASDVE
jgi:hypothetical protein